MPEKCSKHKNVQRFYCAYCNRRLWSLGNPKHFLFYLGETENWQNVVDSNSWIEEFYCGEHGKLWMKLSRKTGSMPVAALATSRDWQQTTHKLQPDTSNPFKVVPNLRENFYISKGQ